MKKLATIYFTTLFIGLSCLPTQANEATINAEAEQLQAAIEAFGVSKKEAKKAANHAIQNIEKEKSAEANQNSMLIVSDDFFTLQPL